MALTSVFTTAQLDYIEHMNRIVSEANAALALLVAKAGLTADLSAGGFKITNLAAPTASNDAASMSYVNSVVTLGGSPSAVAITDLDNGTATARQSIEISAAGAIVGVNRSASPALYAQANLGGF